MGLQRVKGQVQGAEGPVSVEWSLAGSALHVVIQAPAATSGTFVLGNTAIALGGKKRHEFTAPWDGDVKVEGA